jgi:UDP-4-amino-4,6-dideoxy-N-acetyl-beta-L-altrosamine transaminase/dTDP-4-dehydrorhamnose reductase
MSLNKPESTKRKKILITGVSGMLGSNLAFCYRDRHEILGAYNTHPVKIDGVRTAKIDVLSRSSLMEAISYFDPDVVIHCASLTNVDFCELNQDLTEKVNINGTRVISQSIINSHCKLVYVSSDSVYEGVKGGYSESDPVNPQNYYGESKYRGELEALEVDGSLILRTNIFGWNVQNKNSLAEWILHELRENRYIEGFKDVYFSSIYTFPLANMIDAAIDKNLKGIYNCGGSTSLSKYDFAVMLSEKFGLNKALIKPISADDYSFRAKRAKNLTMNVDKLTKDLDFQPPAIARSIEDFHSDYVKGVPEKIKQEGASYPKYFSILSYGRQMIDDHDIESVVNVLRSLNLTQGPNVSEFESSLCKNVDVRSAVAVNSGTAALHISCLAIGVGPGDEVITSPITFVASANCAVYCGAKPVFADILPETYNISPEEIAKHINERTKAIIPVHFAGQSCDMEEIRQIVNDAERKYGHKIYIIEDACHALGSLYKGSKVGSCRYSDLTVMSFHPVKHITTGEGGAVFANDEDLFRKLKLFRSHGITSDPKDFMNKDLAFPHRDPQSEIHGPQNPWYYEQIALGYNYRITDIQCALGVSQLKKLDSFIKRRRDIVNTYNTAFRDDINIKIPFESDKCVSNFHLYVLLFDFEKIGIDRGRFMLNLRERGVQTQVHYIPVHLQSFYRERFGTKRGDCPVAEKYYEKCLSIPLYPTMSDNDVMKVVSEIKRLIRSK